jgi:hypothetical protein
MQSNQILQNYGFSESTSKDNSIVQIEQSRAAQEVQAAYVIAKKFPRDENQAFTKIMKACERPFLAEQAMYAYPRGNQVVTGPSIRLAEVLAQSWGNIDVGIREISQSNGISVAEAYAVDLETNFREVKIFHVPHERHTKKGTQRLTDPRDIYELVANQGARRMRACILAVIPGDIVEAAIERCKYTVTNGKEPLIDRLRKLVLRFDEVGITLDQIEKRLGHKLDATIPAEAIQLQSILKSLKDGMAKRDDFFDVSAPLPPVASEINEKITQDTKKPKDVEKNSEISSVKKISFDSVKNKLNEAKSLDTLHLAADLIRELEEKEQIELTNFYREKEKVLK